jgi:hypothetical protein
LDDGLGHTESGGGSAEVTHDAVSPSPVPTEVFDSVR